MTTCSCCGEKYILGPFGLGEVPVCGCASAGWCGGCDHCFEHCECKRRRTRWWREYSTGEEPKEEEKKPDGR